MIRRFVYTTQGTESETKEVSTWYMESLLSVRNGMLCALEPRITTVNADEAPLRIRVHPRHRRSNHPRFMESRQLHAELHTGHEPGEQEQGAREPSLL